MSACEHRTPTGVSVCNTPQKNSQYDDEADTRRVEDIRQGYERDVAADWDEYLLSYLSEMIGSRKRVVRR